MKNYSKNYEESKTFITSYKLENGEIKIKYANGDTKLVPFKQEKEKEILDTMETQAKYAKAKPLKLSELFLALAQPMFFAVSISNAVSAVDHNAFFIAMAALTAIPAIYYPYKALDFLLKQDELRKLNYFLDNKEELNESLADPKARRNNVTDGISKKASNRMEKDLSSRHNTDVINMNNIGSYSLDDLIIIKSNIEALKTSGKIKDSNIKTLKKQPRAAYIFANPLGKKETD